ncbi:MAG: trypsin-like peptidase domain-containing protein [Thermoanaerobaculales bacterium]
MRCRLARAIVVLVPFALCSCDSFLQKSPSEVFSAVAPSVYTITVSDVSRALILGSAVALAPDLVATNKHVVGGDIRRIFEISRGDKTWRAYPTYFDPDQDLCILRAPGLGARPVTLGKSSRLHVGDRVLAVGSPKGLELSASEGLISGIRPTTERSNPMLQTTAAISRGSSGGGLFDLRGRLIGITTSMLTDAQSIAFAIGADDVRVAITRLELDSSKALGLASVLLAAGRSDEAKPILEVAVSSEPKLAVAWLALAGPSPYMDENSEKCLRAAVQANPALKEGWVALAREYSLMQFNEEFRAREIQRSGGITGSGSKRQTYLLKQIDVLERAISLDPADADVSLDLARSYLDDDRGREAQVLAERVTVSQPNNLDGWTTLGLVYWHLGRLELAAAAFRRVVDEPPLTSANLRKQEVAWFALKGLASDRGDREGERFCHEKYYEVSRREGEAANKESATRDEIQATRERQAAAAIPSFPAPRTTT